MDALKRFNKDKYADGKWQEREVVGVIFLHGTSEEFTFAVGLIHPGPRRYRVECMFF